MMMAVVPMDRTRIAERSGTFLKAKLERAGDVTREVVVRNLSESGALIEGNDLPELGLVTLLRGDLRVEARIIRCEGRQRGLHFRETIQLPRWLPHTAMREIIEASEDDRRLGDRRGESPGRRANDLALPSNLPIHERIAEELQLLERQFGRILDTFAEDPIVVMRHPRALTRLESSQQLLRGLAAVLTAADPEAEANKLSMEEVRRRLLR